MHGRGGLSLDSNPVCLRVNATNLEQDLDQNPRVNRAYDYPRGYTHLKMLNTVYLLHSNAGNKSFQVGVLLLFAMQLRRCGGTKRPHSFVLLESL